MGDATLIIKVALTLQSRTRDTLIDGAMRALSTEFSSLTIDEMQSLSELKALGLLLESEELWASEDDIFDLLCAFVAQAYPETIGREEAEELFRHIRYGYLSPVRLASAVANPLIQQDLVAFGATSQLMRQTLEASDYKGRYQELTDRMAKDQVNQFRARRRHSAMPHRGPW